MMDTNLFSQAQAALRVCSVAEKLQQTEALAQAWQAEILDKEILENFTDTEHCGCPEVPKLVPASQLAQRGLDTPEGHGALLHAIAHIEFSAINLALDAVARFREMPKAYYDDWVRIADEERYHFSLLQGRLAKLGLEYGDFPAHNGLWRTAVETADDVLVRMALVPRVLEARGLDVTPGIIKKLQAIGDKESVAILQIIHRDEIGHVAAGTRWFHYLCDQRGLDADATFAKVVRERFHGLPKGPFALAARAQAGFSEKEMQFLQEGGI